MARRAVRVIGMSLCCAILALSTGKAPLFGWQLSSAPRLQLPESAPLVARSELRPGAGPGQPALVYMDVPRAESPPTIDGNVDEWYSLTPAILNKDTASWIEGSQLAPTYADLSVHLRAAWTPDMLYFAAVIADDVLIGNDSPYFWDDDTVELGIYVPQAGRSHQFS